MSAYIRIDSYYYIYSKITEEKMRGSKIAGTILALVFILTGSFQLYAQDYAHEAKAKNISFNWKIEGSELMVKISPIFLPFEVFNLVPKAEKN